MTSLKQHILDNHDIDDLKNLATNISGGISGFTYYTETSKIYEEFKYDIWELINSSAEEQGVSPMVLISTLGGGESVCDHETFVNLLVWFSAEETARQILQEKNIEI